ncbi:MAG TPA: GspH/FimT family pseudopilin [Acidobacteriota bacterium]|nr:GspH/FimT family pseudopilin [Acidobacteriota bacterium]
MRPKYARGYTFVELLLVLAAGAVIASVAVPQVQQSLSIYRLMSSASRLASELDYARTLAMSRNAVFQVAINPTTRTFQIVDEADLDHPPRSAHRLEAGIQFVNPPAQIRFFSRGHAQQGDVTLSDGWGSFITIEVSPSGLVRLGNVESNETY